MKKSIKKLLKDKKKLTMIGSGLLLVILLGVGGFIIFGGNGKKKTEPKKDKPTEIKEPEKKVTIVDLESNSRPYGVMINNHPAARKNHAGLQDAYIIYELTVEGGMTRYFALFKDQETNRIGSVRSSRHYYLDYALENDAIYVHWGWSPQAQSDIRTLGINNINGLAYEGIYFYREKGLGVSLEHTGFTRMSSLKTATTKLKYRSITDKGLLLNYSADSVDYSKLNNVKDAKNVTIKYSNSVTNQFVYDENLKVYNHFVNNVVHKDLDTGKQYTFKNIITYQVQSGLIPNDPKGRLNFNNIGSGKGYLITEGKAIPINWKKDSRSSKTVYTYENGEVIKVNDGNTFIEIQPVNQELTIS